MQKFLSRFNNFPKYLLAGVLIIVCLYPKFPFIKVPGTYVSIRLEDFLLLILGIITFVKILTSFKSFLKDKLITALLLFFAVGLVSLVAGIFITQGVQISIGVLHFLRRIEYTIPLFAVFALLKRRDVRSSLDFYIKILMIIIFVAFIYGLGQRYFNVPVIDTQNEEYSKGIALRWTPGAHINATFAGHYDLASFIVLVLPIFTTLFFLTDKWKSKLWLMGVIIPSFWLMGMSLSRISLASWVIASCLALILVKKYKATLAIVAAAILIVIAFPSYLGRYQQLLKVVGSSGAGIEVLAASETSPEQTPVPVREDRSTSIRLDVEWPRAMMAFYKNPLLGTGYSSIGLATDNDYLRVLAEIGLIGFAAFGLVFYRIGGEFLKFYKNRSKFDVLETSYLAGMTGAIVGTFVTAIFLDIFEASKFATIYWLLIGYAVILIRNRLYEQ